MDRSAAEVLDLISEIERPFNNSGSASSPVAGIWARNDALEAFQRGIWDMMLPDYLNHKEPIYSHDIDEAIAQIMGMMAGPFEIEIAANSGKKSDQARCDDRAVWNSNWLIRHNLAQGGWVYNAWLRDQAGKVAVVNWLQVKDYGTPKRDLTKEPRTKAGNAAYNARVDEYERTFDPLELVVDPLRTTAWMQYEDEVTTASCVFWMPIIDFLRRFGDYKRGEERSRPDFEKLMLQIAGQQFPGLRAGEPVPEYGPQFQTWSQRRVKVRMLDDGVTWDYYIEGLEIEDRARNSRRGANGVRDIAHQFVKSIPNTLGMVSMFPLSGRYYATEPFGQRHQPVLLALMAKLMNRDYLTSVKASHMMDAIMDAVEVGDATAATLIQQSADANIDKSVARAQPGELTIVPGHAVSLGAPADQIKLLDELLQQVNNDIVRLWPASQYTGGMDAQKMIQEGTMGAILRMDEVTQMPLREPADIRVKAIDRILGAVENFYRTVGQSKGTGSAASSDSFIYYTTTGNETPKGRVVKPGEDGELTPEDLNIPMTRSITTRNSSLSADEAKRAAAQAKYDRPDGTHTITWRQFVAESNPGVDIEKQLADLNEDAMFLQLVPHVFQTSFENWLLLQEAVLNLAPGTLSNQYGIQVQGAAGNMAGGPPPGGPPPEGVPSPGNFPIHAPAQAPAVNAPVGGGAQP